MPEQIIDADARSVYVCKTRVADPNGGAPMEYVDIHLPGQKALRLDAVNALRLGCYLVRWAEERGD